MLIHPFALYIIQPFLESIHYDLIDNLSLSIPLGINWSRIPIRDTKFTTISSESLAIKLKSIFRDKGMRNPKTSDNVLPHKPFGIYVLDVRQWLNFNPLGKVINADQKPSPVFCFFGEGPYNVQASLSKRPETRQRTNNAPWLMNVGSKYLTLVTLLHVFLCFSLHIGPPISLSKSLVRQGSTSCMASTNPFAQLF